MMVSRYVVLVGVYRISADGILAVTLRLDSTTIVPASHKYTFVSHSTIKTLEGRGEGGGVHRFFRPQN